MTPTLCPRCAAPVLHARSHATGRHLVLDAEPRGWSGGWAVDQAGWATAARRYRGLRAHACPPVDALPGMDEERGR